VGEQDHWRKNMEPEIVESDDFECSLDYERDTDALLEWQELADFEQADEYFEHFGPYASEEMY
jgi:hypothetical protein